MTAYLPDEILMQLLPATFEPWGSSSWYPSRPPTNGSLLKIRDTLGVEIPEPFVRVATACSSYGGWFGSIGEDYDSHNHLLSINQAMRRAGVPARYVLLNHGHDGDCDAWDTAGPLEGGEFPIVYFLLNDDGSIGQLCETHKAFRAYIDDLCRSSASACPDKALRRRAKQLLAEHSGSTAN